MRTGAVLGLIGGVVGLLGGAAYAAGPGYHVIQKIPGPDGGWDYARVDEKADRLFVTRGSSVMAVDLKTGKVIPGLVPGARQHIALPVNGGAQILVTNGGDNTAIFADPMTGAALGSVPVAKGPDAAAEDPRTGLVLVMGHVGGAVTLVDPKARKALGDIDIGGTLEEGAADGAGHAFVAVEDKHEVAELDLARKTVIARWPIKDCEGPGGLTYDPQDKLVIAACNAAVAIVDAKTGAVKQMLPMGKGADGAIYDAKRHLAFVPAGRDGNLAVIGFDHGQAKILETVPTQPGARTLALDERTGRVYLPSATYQLPAGGGRPTIVPGSFQVIVVGR